MTLNQLYDLLEIDTPSQFEYFEQLADLLETDEEIGFDQFFALLTDVDTDTLKELIGNYMEDLCNAIPDRYDDLVSLADSVQQKVLLLAENADKNGTKNELIQELYRFRQWYHKEDAAMVDQTPCCVMDALFTARSEKYSGEEHDYDFAGAMDYEIGDMSVSLGSFSTIDVSGKTQNGSEEEIPAEDADDGTLIIDASYDPYRLD